MQIAPAESLRNGKFQFVCLNCANPDVVGPAGVFEATVKMVEAADEAGRALAEAAHNAAYSVIADHSNAECMRNEVRSPNTTHSTTLIPHLIIKDGIDGLIQPGKSGDIAPTVCV